MPRSHGVIKTEVWEPRSDFRQLPLDGQWAFTMLISQPQINNLGVLPYIPEKWVRLAVDLDSGRLIGALELLEDLRYTITDTGTGELLVRTFIRHDGVWKQPKLVTNARRLYRETESAAISSYLADRHPWLTDDSWNAAKITSHETKRRRPETPSFTPPDTPSVRGSDTPNPKQQKPLSETEGVNEPLPEGVSLTRARVRDGLPQDQPQAQGLPPLSKSKAVALPTRAARDQRTAHGEITHISTTITDGLRYGGTA